MPIQRLQAQSRGGMAPGAEGQPRIQPQLHPVGAAGLLPLRDYQQPLADLHGLIKLLPVVLPVGVRHGSIGKPRLRQGREHLLHGTKTLFSVAVIRQIEGHPAKPLLLPQKVVVHIVPVLMVIFQKIFKIRLVVNDQAFDPHILQTAAQVVQSSGAGINARLDPVHRVVPIKKMPMVFGPVWLPITGPM